MKSKLLLTGLLLFFFVTGFSQVYENPYVGSVGDGICYITKVEFTKQHTIVSFEHLNNNGWIRLDPKIYINTPDGKRYHYVKSEGISISPQMYYFKPDEKKHSFIVYFQPIPSDTRLFDIIEVEPGTKFDFNFYGVDLTKKRTSDEQTSHFPEDKYTDVVLTPPPPPKFMNNFGDMYKEIYKSSIDVHLNYLGQPEILKKLAQISRSYYEALVAAGFTKEQAMQIVIAAPLIPNSPAGK
ncbi:hypothetical protein [Desertivirga xinjiangensis]|uniref:hypothetical protein n=1 Tax=Desertivirga xinjiangensis TaxID=539206 RepID=UPI00210A4DA0|nr:hypothetical protein [Pedobacter xinjiangensis]